MADEATTDELFAAFMAGFATSHETWNGDDDLTSSVTIELLRKDFEKWLETRGS